MSIMNRILLILLSVAGLVMAGSLILFVSSSSYADQFANDITSSPDNLYYIIVAIVVALLSLRFFFYRWRAPMEDYVSMPGEHGNIRISYETIQQLANRTGKVVRGVQEFDTRVRPGQTGLILSVRVKALPDVELSNMSHEIQTSVKTYVEKTSGVAVEQVMVNIVQITNSASKPPRTWVES